MRLGELNANYARRLLLQTAQTPREEWQSREKEADKIVELLGSHTLGLIQAGAYIAQGFCRLDQYRVEFEKNRKRMLQTHPNQASLRNKNVYATFEISAKALEDSHSKADQDARELLSVLTMLHSSVLLLDIFKYAWAGARVLSQSSPAEMSQTSKRDDHRELDLGPWHISHLPRFINTKAKEWDDYRLKAASARLISLSLVTRHSMGDVDGVSMHPLAHVWAKEQLQAEHHRQAWITTGCVLSFSYHLEVSLDWWWRNLRELQPHILPFFTFNVQKMLSFEPSNEILAILVSSVCGWMLHWMGEDTKLEHLLKEIYQSLGIDPSAPSPKYIRLWLLAGSNLMKIDRVSEEVKLYQSIIGINAATGVLEKVDNGWSRLTLQRHLAGAYRLDEQVPEAIKLLEEIIHVHEGLLNKDNRSRIAVHYELAQAYSDNGQVTDAIKLLERIVDVQKTVLHEAHQNLIAPQYELALAYWEKLADTGSNESTRTYRQDSKSLPPREPSIPVGSRKETVKMERMGLRRISLGA